MQQCDQVDIVRRMLIKDLTQGVVRRIVDVDNSTDRVWLCNINDDSWPIPMPTSRLLEELDPEKGHFVIEQDDPYARPRIIAPPDQESATDRLQRERYALIEPLVTGDNAVLILSKHLCKRLVDQRLKEVKSTRQTIYALLKQWWKRGMTYEAIRPDYGNCGTSKEPRKVSGEKTLGRPRIIATGTCITVNDKVRKIIRKSADYWLRRKEPSLQQAIDFVCRFHFGELVKDQNGRAVAFEVQKDKKPTPRQLQYYIQKNYSYSHIQRRRKGDKNWNLQGRPLKGRADAHIQGPGYQFIIDATVADEYLVSQFDMRRIVGRPIIYFVVDAFSSLIVGVYVGFEGPSWIGAMMALVNTVTPKVAFCKEYDIDIEESEWPSHHGCRRLEADKGELMSVDLGKNITRHLHIQIENPGSGRPDLKALVERRFGIVPAKWRPFALGYVEKDFNKRGEPDCRLSAAYNLFEFTQLVILAVLNHNLSPIRDKRMDPAMITDGYEASPLDLWEWGIMNCSGSLNLNMLTVEEVALNVMPSTKAVVTEHGIRVCKGGFYSCATAIREEWFAKARHKEWKVEMSFDPRRMEYAYLRDPKLPRGFEVCNLMEPSDHLRGKSLFEIEELDIARKKTQAANENKRQAKRIFFDHKSSEIQKHAKKAKRDAHDPSASKAEMTAGIRENKADEKEVQRAVESFVLTDGDEGAVATNSQKIPAAPSVSHVISKDLELLKEKRKLREGGVSR